LICWPLSLTFLIEFLVSPHPTRRCYLSSTLFNISSSTWAVNFFSGVFFPSTFPPSPHHCFFPLSSPPTTFVMRLNPYFSLFLSFLVPPSPFLLFAAPWQSLPPTMGTLSITLRSTCFRCSEFSRFSFVTRTELLSFSPPTPGFWLFLFSSYYGISSPSIHVLSGLGLPRPFFPENFVLYLRLSQYFHRMCFLRSGRPRDIPLSYTIVRFSGILGFSRCYLYRTYLYFFSLLLFPFFSPSSPSSFFPSFVYFIFFDFYRSSTPLFSPPPFVLQFISFFSLDH